jgi:predicted ester cyclase
VSVCDLRVMSMRRVTGPLHPAAWGATHFSALKLGGYAGRVVSRAKEACGLTLRASTPFPDARFALEDQIAEGDKVVRRWTARGTHRGEFLGIYPTVEEVALTGIEFDHVVGGKIEETWVSYHPFAGPVLDREWVKRGFAASHQALLDIRMAEADSIREGNSATFRWLMSGTHKGEFLGVAPTGERIEAMG